MKLEEKYILNTNFPEPLDIDESLFNEMMDFIIDLDENQLTEDQLNKVIDILNKLESVDEITEIKKTKRTPLQKKLYARKYRKLNRNKIKMKRKKFTRSAEGKRRKRIALRMQKSHKTPTGRRKIKYNR